MLEVHNRLIDIEGQKRPQAAHAHAQYQALKRQIDGNTRVFVYISANSLLKALLLRVWVKVHVLAVHRCWVE